LPGFLVDFAHLLEVTLAFSGKLLISKPLLLLKKITFRPLKNIDIASFASDLAQLPVINDQVRRVRLCLRNTTLGFFRFSTSMFHGYLSQWFFALCLLG
jgi:hypothetical protein